MKGPIVQNLLYLDLQSVNKYRPWQPTLRKTEKSIRNFQVLKSVYHKSLIRQFWQKSILGFKGGCKQRAQYAGVIIFQTYKAEIGMIDTNV